MRKSYRYLPLILGFILGCHNRYIALWEDGASVPKQVFPYHIEALPPADQQALRDGVHVDSAEELAQLVEDYLS